MSGRTPEESAERAIFLATCRYAIAVCKQEVEKVIPEEMIDARDAGSPWGRAWLICMEESDKAEDIHESLRSIRCVEAEESDAESPR